MHFGQDRYTIGLESPNQSSVGLIPVSSILFAPGGGIMFESLDDTMKHDDEAVTTKKQRAILWASVAVVTVALFGGLYYAVRMLGE
jgi:hypothetical protein